MPLFCLYHSSLMRDLPLAPRNTGVDPEAGLCASRR